MACVDLPFLPLQMLLLRHADWRERPVAVVDDDRPQGKILWINDRARTNRILPGMRYAAALSLAGDLRAAVVSPQEIEATVASLGERLRRLTPHVEPAADEPGVFWLDPRGLERLHGSPRDWAVRVRGVLERAGFRATVVVGFGRFGTYALARARRGILVLRDAREERAAARGVPLDRLALEPVARDALGKLGITRVGQLVDLPIEGIEKRFGPQAYRLHRMASGQFHLPLQPELPAQPAIERRILDHAETDVGRLLVRIERMLAPLLDQLERRARAATGIQVGFRFERLGDHVETVRPAAPTLDRRQLLELIRLRLQAVRRLPDGVSEIVLVAQETDATPRQRQLLEQPRRDLAAADRALARVRAELGDRAVVRARLREAHLPEGSFTWEALGSLEPPRPRAVDTKRLVRRIYAEPVSLPPRPRQEPDGWMLRGLEQGPVVRVSGPYVVSGRWWHRAVHREYHFAETRKGELLWVYYDRAHRRWFLQGRVE